MTLDALAGVLGIPLIAAALFAAVPNYRIAARSNIAATGLTLICALSLFFAKPTARFVPVGRRSERHVYRSHELRGLYDQHLQRELYRP